MDEKKLRKVFITGADKGLGLSLVSRFLRAGWWVFAGFHTTEYNLASLGKEYAARLVRVPLDVTDMASIVEARQQVSAQIQELDILINNAAIYLPPKPSRSLKELDLTDGHLETLFDVNAFGPLRVTQQFLPLLEKGSRKLILNISSEAGSIGNSRRTSEYGYCMSKAALNMQSRILQNALASQGFRVLAVQPGWMRTGMGGPGADIHPDESAEGIFNLAQKPPSTGEPMYVDYQGNPLPW